MLNVVVNLDERLITLAQVESLLRGYLLISYTGISVDGGGLRIVSYDSHSSRWLIKRLDGTTTNSGALVGMINKGGLVYDLLGYFDELVELGEYVKNFQRGNVYATHSNR